MPLARRRLLTCALSLVVACLFCGVLSAPAFAQNGNSTVRVMSRNMDAGTDLAYVMTATTMPDFAAGVVKTVMEVDASNIPARAVRLAAEIAAAKPDLVALQEVTLWDITDASGHRVYDQLALLQQALAAAGQHYRLVALQPLTDIPAAYPGVFDVRFTDHNAILARSDLPPGHLEVLSTQTHVFEHAMPFQLPDGTPIPVLNGWMAADVRIRGARFTLANTHLMSATPGPYFEATAGLQALQGQEVVEGLNMATTLPIILAGDFNSDAEAAGIGPDQTQTAALIAAAGYTDVWHLLHANDQGFTWPLFGEDQAIPVYFPILSPIERIDLIYAVGPAPLAIRLTGTTASTQGVFASDHAGVLADFALDNHRPNVPVGKK